MIWHHYVTHQKKSILSPDPTKFLDEQVSCSRCPKQRQPPVATERQKMKMTMPLVPLQSLWHSTPKPPPSKTEGGAPPSCYSPMNYKNGILSSHAALKRKERTAPPGHPSRNFEYWENRRFNGPKTIVRQGISGGQEGQQRLDGRIRYSADLSERARRQRLRAVHARIQLALLQRVRSRNSNGLRKMQTANPGTLPLPRSPHWRTNDRSATLSSVRRGLPMDD